MHPRRRQKMSQVMALVFVIGIIIALVLYALRQNISLFYSPTDLAAGLAPREHAIRLGGMVVLGSIVHDEKLKVRFRITDYHDTIDVVYQGILPDLFREEKGVVTEGIWLGQHQFKATRVLAKHDENYMPRDVKNALVKVNT